MVKIHTTTKVVRQRHVYTIEHRTLDPLGSRHVEYVGAKYLVGGDLEYATNITQALKFNSRKNAESFILDHFVATANHRVEAVLLPFAQ